MCCKNKFAVKFVALLFVAVGISSILSGADDAVTSNGLAVNHWSCFSIHAPTPPSQMMFHSSSSEPLAQLFQILFILFIISPPIIVVLLILIYRELKSRNKLK